MSYIGCMENPRSTLPDALAVELAGSDLIVFDAECVLCSGFFRFMYRRNDSFNFATAQSPLGQRLYAALNLALTDFETNLVIVDGQIHQELDAFSMAMQELNWPWKALGVARFLPAWIKSPLYKTIRRNRFRVFGRYDTCMVPDAELRARFLKNGF
ncbi:hypothetical protein ASD8599_00742 [Ascidiaceihabitans donghaensis]|uniref:Thiol-disulfide oxidoreductase DCC n=1 Tax=Ascidiaceihabitans donghaensis TaxID=1510460 RepID=A0A2R8BAA6_9RHOB|nr:DCC1-like thiol-disulfide oxidoreductase family protein [Ascidiaceihabitans donghaensis]SPH20002.1 hypothetical protein ASD8599_00742 [Ascidiaceihabitans donghaensis]